jgi:hypothetical protein
MENSFKSKLVRDLRFMFTEAIILKNDANYLQGVPDVLILYGNRWAVLECKDSFDSPYRVNQEYYIKIMNDMSFARMICPENKEEVLDELQSALRPNRFARVSKR